MRPLSGKTAFSLYGGFSLAPVLMLVERYLFNDWQFLSFLMILVVVDTVTGVYRHWRSHTVSSRSFSRLFTKCIIYMVLLVLSHVMTQFPVHGEQNVLFKWFDNFLYSAMMAREALSILENMAAIDPSLVPAGLLKRLAQISTDGVGQDQISQPAAEGTVDALNLPEEAGH